MRFLKNPSTDPYWNMAFDEWCLEHIHTSEAVFCLWRNSPSVIIGHNQDAEAEVNIPYLKEHGISLVRRSTGGGAVYHDLQNLNYSFYRPLRTGEVPEADSHDPCALLIAKALRSMGAEAEVGGRNDIFVEGRKVSGFAKRIWHDRALVHGTLMYDVDIDTLTKVLDTPESKLHRKGVASVKSRVTNLKDVLPGISDIDDLASELESFLRASGGEDGKIVLDASQLSEVDALADTKRIGQRLQ